MTDKRELKPCPFCGGKAKIDFGSSFAVEPGAADPSLASIRCENGCCYTTTHAVDKVTRDWNTRPASGDAVEALEREAMRLWEESPAIAKIDAYVRPEWMEVSERSRVVWRGKALSMAVARQERGTATLTTEAPAQTEQGGERADLQGQKQSANTTATPPTSAQTEAMALAVERLGFTIEERAGVDVVVYGGKEAGCRPANMNELALWSELQAALRQPASVEAEPVALLREALLEAAVLFETYADNHTAKANLGPESEKADRTEKAERNAAAGRKMRAALAHLADQVQS